MMSNKVNEFKLLKTDFFKSMKHLKMGKLNDKYDLWFNQVTDTWMHSKSFGDDADHKFGTDMGITVRFVLDREVVEITGYAYGGMTWFSFEKEDIENMSGLERDCAEYVMQMINDLIDWGIIEVIK